MTEHRCHLVPSFDPAIRGERKRMFITYCDCGWGSSKHPTESLALLSFRGHIDRSDVSHPSWTIEDSILSKRNQELRAEVARLTNLLASIEKILRGTSWGTDIMGGITK